MKLSNGKTLSVSTQRLKMYIAGHRHGLLPARSIFYHNYMRRQLAETLAPPIFFPCCDSLSHLKCHLRCTCMLATGYNIDLPRCLRNENYIHIAYSIKYLIDIYMNCTNYIYNIFHSETSIYTWMKMHKYYIFIDKLCTAEEPVHVMMVQGGLLKRVLHCTCVCIGIFIPQPPVNSLLHNCFWIPIIQFCKTTTPNHLADLQEEEPADPGEKTRQIATNQQAPQFKQHNQPSSIHVADGPLLALDELHIGSGTWNRRDISTKKKALDLFTGFGLHWSPWQRWLQQLRLRRRLLLAKIKYHNHAQRKLVQYTQSIWDQMYLAWEGAFCTSACQDNCANVMSATK